MQANISQPDIASFIDLYLMRCAIRLRGPAFDQSSFGRIHLDGGLYAGVAPYVIRFVDSHARHV